MNTGTVGVVRLFDGKEYVYFPEDKSKSVMRSPNINALAMALVKFGVKAVSFAASKKIGSTVIAEQKVEVKSINVVELIRFVSVFS